MVRFLPRLSVFRALPRPSPILPIAFRLNLPRTVLTHNQRLTTNWRFFSRSPARLTASPPLTPSNNAPSSLPPGASLTQRLKHLIKSYGWYALGVYALLSVTDFGVAFAGIHLLGAEYVARIAAEARALVFNIAGGSRPPEPGREEQESVHAAGQTGGHEGLYAMLVLAYTVHKTLFLPVRVGLTAALTPKLVGWLGKRGWAGGEGTRRAATEMRERMRRNRP